MEDFLRMVDQVLPIYLFDKLTPYIVVAFIIGIVTGWLSCDANRDKSET